MPGRGGGWGPWLGNTLFSGSVAATAYFGYYTYRYSSDQLDTMVQETQKAENAFPGSQVAPYTGSFPRTKGRTALAGPAYTCQPSWL